jgi:hypothetical protein
MRSLFRYAGWLSVRLGMRLSFSGRGKRETRLRPGQRNEAHVTAVAPHREPDWFLDTEIGRSTKEVHDPLNVI